MKMFDRQSSRHDRRTGGYSRQRCSIALESLENRQLMASSLAFDFGPQGSTVAPGAIGAAVDAYTPGNHHGWSSTTGLHARDLGGSNPITRDVVTGRKGTFLVALPDGSYDVTATVAALGRSPGRVAIRAEGLAVKPASSVRVGRFSQETFRVDVTNGHLDLDLAAKGGRSTVFAIAGLKITPTNLTPSTSPVASAPSPAATAASPSVASSLAPAASVASTAAVNSAEVQLVPVPTNSATSPGAAATSMAASMPMTGSGMPMGPGMGVYLPSCCTNPTVTSIKSGLWSDPSTWSTHQVPAGGDVVSIAGSTTVTYDTTSDTPLDCVVIQSTGKLTFRTDINTRITVGTMAILANGSLEVGTASNPVDPRFTADIVIADEPIDLSTDPNSVGTGILGWGKVDMHGSTKTNFVTVATEPHAGDTTLTLAQAPIGWQVGDRLILPDSRSVNIGNNDSTSFKILQSETAVIRSISGNTVSLAQPLTYDHRGAVDASGAIRFLPDVTDMTRNIDIRSANPSGTRGHVLMTGRADVDIEYVWFKDLGRTLNSQAVDQTTYDASGNPVTYATNQIARYPLHMHHLIGPATPQANGYEFTLIGNAIDGGDTPNDHKWGIDVHASSNGLIQDNAIYNTSGAGYVTEDGSESYNVFQHNIAILTDGLGVNSYSRIAAPFPDFGHAGDGFWFQGPNNIVRDNVAADSRASGFEYYSSEFGLEDYHVPLFKGADVMAPGQYSELMNGQMPFGAFSHNESYSAAESGLTVRFVYGTPNQALFDGMTTWNSASGFVNNSMPTAATLRDFVVIGTSARAASYDYWRNPSFGLNIQGFNGGNVAVNVVVQHADLENVGVGIITPTNTTAVPSYSVDQMIVTGQPVANGTLMQTLQDANSAGPFTIADTIFRNNPTDVLVNNQSASPDTASLDGNRTVIINNSSFSHTATPGYEAISTDLWLLNGGVMAWDYRKFQQVLVYGFDRKAGDDFQVFFPQQAPGVVMPQSNYVIIGSPEAGLTNQQNWDKYGIAIGGELTPSDATTRPGILGSVAPIRPVPARDSTPPVISGVTAGPLSPDGTVTVSWQTDEPADTQIFYEPYLTGMSAGRMVDVGARYYVYTTSHSLVLSGLDPHLSYRFTILARDPAGDYSTQSSSFGDIQPPVISNPTVTYTASLTSANVAWSTDEVSTTIIEYGLTTKYESMAYGQGWTTNHAVTLTGLQPFTNYHYRVISKDQSGNQAVSEDRTFQVGSQHSIVETTDPGFSVTGPSASWSSGQLWFGNTVSKWFMNWNSSAQAGVSATWAFGNLPAGEYRVYTTWNSGYTASQVPYTISDGQGVAGTAIVDQQQWPNGFFYEGESLAQIADLALRGGSVSVTMEAASQGLSRTFAGTMILVRIS